MFRWGYSNIQQYAMQDAQRGVQHTTAQWLNPIDDPFANGWNILLCQHISVWNILHWEWIAETEGAIGLSGPQVLRGKVQDWPISRQDTHWEATAPKCCANMDNKISSVTYTAFNVKQHGKMYWSLNNILHVKSICQYCHVPTHSSTVYSKIMFLITVLYKTVIQNYIFVLRSMVMSGQFTKKLIIISVKLKTLCLYIWSLHSSAIKNVFKRKKSTHPSDQKKVNCWDQLMIRSNTVSTLKAELRRAGTNREGFYSSLVFTLGDVCAKPSRFSDRRRSALYGRSLRKEGPAGSSWHAGKGSTGRWERVGQEFLSLVLKVWEEQCWERQAATPRSAKTDNPPPVLSPPRPGFSITFTHSWLWTV